MNDPTANAMKQLYKVTAKLSSPLHFWSSVHPSFYDEVVRWSIFRQPYRLVVNSRLCLVVPFVNACCT